MYWLLWMMLWIYLVRDIKSTKLPIKVFYFIVEVYKVDDMVFVQVFIECSIEVALERNQMRPSDKRLPVETLRKISSEFQKPTNCLLKNDIKLSKSKGWEQFSITSPK